MPSIEDALALASSGFFVFPLSPGSKKPYNGSRGHKSATVNTVEIQRAWRNDSNIGINCGLSNVVVLDIDPKNGGMESFEQIKVDFGTAWMEGARIVTTPSGGLHIYFAQPPDRIKRIHNVLPGIDILGDGGYVVAPPSVLANGSGYTGALDGETLPFFPTILRKLVPSEKPNAASTTLTTPGSLFKLNRKPPIATATWGEGSRNNRLMSLAGSLRKQGIPDDVVLTVLESVNARHCAPPLDRREVVAIASSAAKYNNGIGDRLEFLIKWKRNEIKTPSELVLLETIIESADDKGRWAPPLAQLLSSSGLSRPTFYRAKEALVLAGAIKVTSRGKSLSTIYELQRFEDRPPAITMTPNVIAGLCLLPFPIPTVLLRSKEMRPSPEVCVG